MTRGKYDPDKARVAGWARIYRFEREDREKVTLDDDPEMDAEQLAKIAGCSVRHMKRLLSSAGVGRLVKSDTGTGQRKRVVKMSELLELKEDYALHYALFGEG